MTSEPARLGEISFDFAGIPPRRDEYFPYEHTQVDKHGKWADSAHLHMNGPLIWTGCLYLTELIDLSIYQSILCIIFMCAHVLLPACGFLRDFIDPSLSIYFSVTPFIRTLFIVLYIFPVVYLGPSQKPVMKIIAKAFNDWKPLTVFTKISIIDVW